MSCALSQAPPPCGRRAGFSKRYALNLPVINNFSRGGRLIFHTRETKSIVLLSWRAASAIAIGTALCFGGVRSTISGAGPRIEVSAYHSINARRSMSRRILISGILIARAMDRTPRTLEFRKLFAGHRVRSTGNRRWMASSPWIRPVHIRDIPSHAAVRMSLADNARAWFDQPVFCPRAES
ncbi:MAG TPA: hypothetical protein VKT27_06800 [Candidatus Binataceae bacterium]|nr:hypothetical protein [Candidatus Binataceae bacterium]